MFPLRVIYLSGQCVRSQPHAELHGEDSNARGSGFLGLPAGGRKFNPPPHLEVRPRLPLFPHKIPQTVHISSHVTQQPLIDGLTAREKEPAAFFRFLIQNFLYFFNTQQKREAINKSEKKENHINHVHLERSFIPAEGTEETACRHDPNKIFY